MWLGIEAFGSRAFGPFFSGSYRFKNLSDRCTCTNFYDLIESHMEHDLSTVWLYFVFTIIFYFSLVSGENMFYANIFSFAHCSDLAISAVEATLLNSFFWAGFGLGRFLGISLSRIWTPKQYIIMP